MKKEKNKIATIQRITILNEIFSCLLQIIQWLPNNIDNASNYMLKSEVLINLLESEDCGSIGGFDRNNPVKKESGFELCDRFFALVRKYNSQNKIKDNCGHSLDELKKYFLKLSKMRDDFLQN